MSKKARNWLIALCVFLVIGLIGMISGNGDKQTEIRVVPAETAAPTQAVSVRPSAVPTAKPSAAPAPASTPALQTLAPVQTGDPVPDRSAPAEYPAPTAAPERDYVLNTSSMKFHVPSCSSVKDMKDYNRKDVHATRDSVGAQGYAPCGKCKP